MRSKVIVGADCVLLSADDHYLALSLAGGPGVARKSLPDLHASVLVHTNKAVQPCCLPSIHCTERLLWSALKTAPAGLPTADLARWLLGGLPAAGDGTCGSLHTLPDLPDFADLRAVLEAGAGPSILTFLEAHHELAWGGDAGWGALPSPRYPLAADFFTASTAAGVSLPPELYGLLEHRVRGWPWCWGTSSIQHGQKVP